MPTHTRWSFQLVIAATRVSRSQDGRTLGLPRTDRLAFVTIGRPLYYFLDSEKFSFWIRAGIPWNLVGGEHRGGGRTSGTSPVFGIPCRCKASTPTACKSSRHRPPAFLDRGPWRNDRSHTGLGLSDQPYISLARQTHAGEAAIGHRNQWTAFPVSQFTVDFV